jgi:hypothetical protein
MGHQVTKLHQKGKPMAAKSETIRASVLDHPANRPERAGRERAEARQEFPLHMYVKVSTVTADNKLVGERIVDNMHIGTMMWLAKHITWSTSKGHMVEVESASQKEIDAYVADRAKQLAERHQG